MNTVKLTSVYRSQGSVETLYRLLDEREKLANISHHHMPSFDEHRRFVASRPYRAWYLIHGPGSEPLGAVYFSKNDEIGLFVFKRYRGQGIGRRALKLLMEKHKSARRFLANVSPHNLRSIKFFKQSGFRHIQNTYELKK